MSVRSARSSSAPRPRNTLTTRSRHAAAVLLCALLLTSAQAASAQSGPSEIGDASLEDLMNMQVTSASRREQRALDVAAAVFVITADEIRDSGLMDVPELLRLAPGVNVARIDGNKWAISIRGFNGRWSDKLLVLVDGRTAYNRLFSGVYWESLSVPIDTIERIEVVRGPGGSIWGTNAINGVINILTKAAKDTSGLAVEASAGTQGAAGFGARYGGGAGSTHYRVHLQVADRGHSIFDPSYIGADDSWQSTIGGFRVDWTGALDDVTLQGDAFLGDLGSLQAGAGGPVLPPGGWPSPDERTDFVSGNILARWTRRVSAGRTIQVQGFTDFWRRRDPTDDEHRSYTFDGDVNYQMTIGTRHELVTGAGYRTTTQRTIGSFFVSMTPEQETLRVFSAFAQDEMRLAGDRVRLTFGTRLEYNTHSNWSVQPTARVLWAPVGQHRLWAAVSRAVRTPGRLDRDVRVNITSFTDETGTPFLLSYNGNPDIRPEELRSSEIGYRSEFGRLLFDATGFFNQYEGLRTVTIPIPVFEVSPGPPHVLLPVMAINGLEADTRGAEFVTRWVATPQWHINGTYAFMTVRAHPLAGADPGATLFGATPRHQIRLESSWHMGSRLTGATSVSRIGAVPLVAAYTRVDARLALTLTPSWSVEASGQNLFDAAHYESQSVDNPTEESQDPRRFSIRLRGTL